VTWVGRQRCYHGTPLPNSLKRFKFLETIHRRISSMVSELTQASARLGSGDVVVHRSPTRRSGLPHPCGELRSGAAFPGSMMEVFGIRPVIRHQAFEAFSPSARVPVRMRRACSSGLTWPLPSSLAAVIGLAYGMPAASVRLRSRTPWPFLSSATPSPPPLPGCPSRGAPPSRSADRMVQA
jgi:hypothetical protein